MCSFELFVYLCLNSLVLSVRLSGSTVGFRLFLLVFILHLYLYSCSAWVTNKHLIYYAASPGRSPQTSSIMYKITKKWRKVSFCNFCFLKSQADYVMSTFGSLYKCVLCCSVYVPVFGMCALSGRWQPRAVRISRRDTRSANSTEYLPYCVLWQRFQRHYLPQSHSA